MMNKSSAGPFRLRSSTLVAADLCAATASAQRLSSSQQLCGTAGTRRRRVRPPCQAASHRRFAQHHCQGSSSTCAATGLGLGARKYCTVAEAHPRFLEIEVCTEVGLSWQRDKHKTAFSEFRLWLAAQVARRNVEGLERERLTFKSRHTPLQAQKNHYHNLYKLHQKKK